LGRIGKIKNAKKFEKVRIFAKKFEKVVKKCEKMGQNKWLFGKIWKKRDGFQPSWRLI